MVGARTRSFSGMALAALVTLAPACRGATLPPGSLAPIRVGVVLTFDLDGVAYGEAIELATTEVNAAGGPLPGRRVELVIAESMNDPDRATREARRLVDEEGVVAILGDGGSTNTLDIATNVTTPGRIPHLSCSATSNLLTEHNRRPASDVFFFRTAPPDAKQATALASVAQTDGGCTDVAILYQADDYGTPFAMALGDELMTRSISQRLIPYTFGRATYATEVAMAIAATPNCVAIIGYPQEAGLIVREWGTASGPTVQWLGADALVSDMFPDEAGGATRIDGFLGTAPVTAPDAPEYFDFRDRYRAYFGTTAEPAAYTASCYDAAALLYLAIAEAGSTDGDAVRDALRRVSDGMAGRTLVAATELGVGLELVRSGAAIDYQGASGIVDFDDLGNVVADYRVWRFQASDSTFPTVRTIRADSL